MKKLIIALLFFAVSIALSGVGVRGEWYKGALHCHSIWSDGNIFPEQVYLWYKDNGYHFAALTDHGKLQIDSDRWKDVDSILLGSKLLADYKDAFGTDYVELRESAGKEQVRLKTIWEMKEQLDEPGRFLVIPGFEMSCGVPGRTLHVNAINVAETVAVKPAETITDSVRLNVRAVADSGAESGRETLFMVNHPAWPYFDVDPVSLAMVPELRFFEMINADGGPRRTYSQADTFWSRESYYDAVNAFRAINNEPLIYGVGTDDAHNYLVFMPRTSTPGECWVVVQAESLDTAELIAAMNRGDFYTSCGVELEKIDFNEKTLTVVVKEKEGVTYKTQFIGTKRDFDQTITPLEVEKSGNTPERNGYTFSPEIGILLAEAEGTTASYTLTDDDLYVRAVITSDEKNLSQAGYEPDFQTAWTVPVR